MDDERMKKKDGKVINIFLKKGTKSRECKLLYAIRLITIYLQVSRFEIFIPNILRDMNEISE